jgi:hypothetical protein
MAVDAGDGRTLDQRLRLIEDRFQIYNLIATHPPSAATGARDHGARADGLAARGNGIQTAGPSGRLGIKLPGQQLLHGSVGLVDRRVRVGRRSGIRIGDRDRAEAGAAELVWSRALRPIRIE